MTKNDSMGTTSEARLPQGDCNVQASNSTNSSRRETRNTTSEIEIQENLNFYTPPILADWPDSAVCTTIDGDSSEYVSVSSHLIFTDGATGEPVLQAAVRRSKNRVNCEVKLLQTDIAVSKHNRGIL